MTCFNVSVCEGKEAGGCGFFFCVLLRKMIKRPEGAQMKILIFLSQISIPLVIFYIVAYGLVNKCKVYEEFVKGAKDGLKTVAGGLSSLIGGWGGGGGKGPLGAVTSGRCRTAAAGARAGFGR